MTSDTRPSDEFTMDEDESTTIKAEGLVEALRESAVTSAAASTVAGPSSAPVTGYGEDEAPNSFPAPPVDRLSQQVREFVRPPAQHTDWYYMSQNDWNRALNDTLSTNTKANVAINATIRLRKYSDAYRITNTDVGMPSPTTCNACKHKEIPCRVFRDRPTGGSKACAFCRLRGFTKCNARDDPPAGSAAAANAEDHATNAEESAITAENYATVVTEHAAQAAASAQRASEVAQELLAENHKLRNRVVNLERDNHKFRDRLVEMMESFDRLEKRDWIA